MIVPCPQCKTSLDLPDDVEGKLVRCPSCKEVFRADPTVLEVGVQAGLPEATPTAVTPKPRDDDEDRPAPRQYSGYDEDDNEDIGDVRRRRDRDRDRDRDEFGRGDDSEELIANAKKLSRSAGILMLCAFIVTTLNIIVNAALSLITQQELGQPNAGPGAPPPGAIMAMTLICLVVLFGPMLIFIGLGAKSLLTLGSRGLIVTAIVMNILLLLLLGGGLAFNIYALASGNLPVRLALVLPTVVMNSFSCIFNLAASVMAMRALAMDEVSQGFAAQQRDGLRRRRY